MLVIEANGVTTHSFHGEPFNKILNRHAQFAAENGGVVLLYNDPRHDALKSMEKAMIPEPTVLGVESKESFVNYLRETLIPDLRESGMNATADDFETCITYMTY